MGKPRRCPADNQHTHLRVRILPLGTRLLPGSSTVFAENARKWKPSVDKKGMWQGTDVWEMHQVPHNCGARNGREQLLTDVCNLITQSDIPNKAQISNQLVRLYCFRYCVSFDWNNGKFADIYAAVLEYIEIQHLTLRNPTAPSKYYED